MNNDQDSPHAPHYARMKGIRDVERPLGKVLLFFGVALVLVALTFFANGNLSFAFYAALISIGALIAGGKRLLSVHLSETFENSLRKRDAEGKSEMPIIIIGTLLVLCIVGYIIGPLLVNAWTVDDPSNSGKGDFWMLIGMIFVSAIVGAGAHFFMNRHGTPTTEDEIVADANRNRKFGRWVTIATTLLPLLAVAIVLIYVSIMP